ncbi:hypothetical protein TSAR_010306 [Trichomalopsis sarcophagae]|uniref:Uncharacterized protein n=1 Tax=Trichomalopsis sarcophagae TaxID=543379 RepID=A0A232EJS5_9HYME|nr:hypothetical protein TSAR_010306 [Trichomalopsis sarcophagae]
MDRSTEWALLFPLKAGLLTMKSSFFNNGLRAESMYNISKTRIRRGSSLSDLDRYQPKISSSNVIYSSERTNEIVSFMPALSNSNLKMLSNQECGSIGDMMNLKKYGGSNWSVRSESLIAKTVPLSTVTPKQSPQHEISTENIIFEIDICRQAMQNDHEKELLIYSKSLTCAQRTLRLSKLIKQQYNVVLPNYLPSSKENIMQHNILCKIFYTVLPKILNKYSIKIFFLIVNFRFCIRSYVRSFIGSWLKIDDKILFMILYKTILPKDWVPYEYVLTGAMSKLPNDKRLKIQ